MKKIRLPRPFKPKKGTVREFWDSFIKLEELIKNKKKNEKNKYRCKHCNEVTTRESNKAWIKSYCDETGKEVHLIRVNDDKCT